MAMVKSDDAEPLSTVVTDDFSTTPLRRYITIVGDRRDNKWICNFGCRVDAYTGSYSRIRAHLIGVKKGEKTPGIILCSKLSPTQREDLRKEEEDARDMFGGVLRKRKPTETPASHSADGKRRSVTSVKDMFKVSARDEADAKIARFFYSCGIPFNVARSPFWKDAVKAINEAPRGYEAPSSEKIKTTLLDKERTAVDNQLSISKRDWSQHGVSIVSSGWSNVRPLINVFAVCSGKPAFLSALDTCGEEKSTIYVADVLLKQVETVGKYNVVQILTDNTSWCQAAGKIITEKLPHVFWSPCVPHTLSLLMEDITQSAEESLKFIGVCYEKVEELGNFIRNHSLVVNIFRKFPALKVLQVKKTRYGHHCVEMERLYKLKETLISMVSDDDEWESMRGTSKAMLTHDTAKEIILDEHFWRDLEFMRFFTRPIGKMIQYCYSDAAAIGDVYQKMEDMVVSIKEGLDQDQPEMISEVEKLVMKRWDKANFPLIMLSYVLNPKYYSESWLQSNGSPKRSKPHADPFVQSVYLSAISKLTSAQDASVIRKQLSDFTSDGGVFGRPEAIEDRKNMTPLEWWNLYGVAAPQLYALAIKVLSQSINSSVAGRELSSYSFVENAKRNKFNSDRAESLVYVHYNNRILTRYDEDYERRYKNWDRNSYEDYLEDDLETMEDQEVEELQTQETKTFTIGETVITI